MQRSVAMKKRAFYCIVAAGFGLALTTLVVWLCAIRPVLAEPSVRHVAETGTDGGNDCTNPASPCRTIQHAIDVANAEDAIHVADGTYTGGDGSVATITKSVTIIGAFDPGFGGRDPGEFRTTLDGGWKGSVVSITGASNVVLEFLTLTRGDGTNSCDGMGCGGGIYVDNAALRVSHCAITNNIGTRVGRGWGGGIYSYESDLAVESTQVVSNAANVDPDGSGDGAGGGVFALAGTASLVQNQITGNAAHVSYTGRGGGVSLVSVTDARLEGNVIQGNRTVRGTISGHGGGIYIENADWFYLANNRVEDNRVNDGYGGRGGGLSLQYSEGHLSGNTIYSNTANVGGGVYLRTNTPITFSNNLIARNRAGYSGGGVYVLASDIPPSRAILANNTIADNGETGVAGWKQVVLTMTNNLIAGHTIGITTTIPASATVVADTNLFWNTTDPIVGTNAILESPLLTTQHRLRAGSPAADQGVTIPWLTVDLDGRTRPQGSAYDIGAFEGQWREVFLPVLLRDS
jgi:hypothetical protein